MPPDFQWHSEEEAWSKAQTGRSRRPSVRLRLRWVALLALLLVLAGGSYWQLRSLTKGVTARSQEEVLAALTLILEAGAEADIPLLAPMLAGGSEAWREAQLARARAGQLLNARTLGWEPAGYSLASATVTFNETLDEAQVTWSATHQVPWPDGGTRSLQFTHTAQLVWEDPRWRLAPLPSDFWGEAVLRRSAGSVLAAYPGLDAPIAERLVGDMAQLMEELCVALADGGCAGVPPLELTFSPGPDPITVQAGSLVMPTPTLLGLPEDDAAYEAMRAAVGAYVLRAAIPVLTGIGCCAHVPFQTALVAAIAADRGLAPWPVAAEDYAALIDHPSPMAELARAWETAEGAEPVALVFLLVDYLRTQAEPAAALAWLQKLRENGPFSDWLAAIASEQDTSAAGLLGDWIAHGLAQVPAGRPAPDLPEGNPLLFCQDAVAATLRRIDLATGDRLVELGFTNRFGHAMGLRPLAGRDGFVLEIRSESDANRDWRTLIWHEGRLVAEFDPGTHRYPVAYTRRSDPSGGRQLMFQRDPDLGQLSFGLLDIDTCKSGLCPLTPADGLPIWAPDGARTLLITGSRFFHGTPEGQRLEPIGRGVLPFWIDPFTYGFLRVASVSSEDNVLTSRLGIFAAAVSDDNEQALFSAADLLPAMPDGAGVDELFLHAVQPHPIQAGRLLAVASANNRDRYFIFTVDLADDRSIALVTYQLALAEPPVRFHFSPGGEWLAIPAGDREEAYATLYVHQLTGGDPRVLPSFQSGAVGERAWFGWDSTGTWLFLLGERQLLLLHPATGFRRAIPAVPPGCYDGLWTAVNPAAPVPDVDFARRFAEPQLSTFVLADN